MAAYDEHGFSRPTLMHTDLDFTKVTSSEDFVAEDEDEDRLVRGLLNQAVAFVGSFGWCEKIVESYIGIAIGGVIGVFLVRIQPSRPDVDEWLWVVVGDIPPAYLVVDDAPNPASAVEAYIREMRVWVEAVKRGDSVDSAIPVLTAGGEEAVRPTMENAVALEGRLQFLDERLLEGDVEHRADSGGGK